VAALLGLALPFRVATASAEPQQAKMELGFRTGFGIPIGRYFDREGDDTADSVAAAGDSLEVSSDAAGQIPIWFDLGARIGQVFVGGTIAYGIVVFSSEHADDCEKIGAFAEQRGGNGSCTFHNLRLGVNAQYHFGASGASIDPWLGGGFGYEWLSQGFFVEYGEREADLGVTYHGFEFLNVQGGVDFPISYASAFGPFVAATLASYQWVSAWCNGSACEDEESMTEGIDETALHSWVFFGVRGTFPF
jgi:hypothetical protein